MLTRAEQDELIVSHLPQAYAIAVSIYNRIGRRMPLEDLQQYGALGLVKAAASFDPSPGWMFKTYAEYRIRGAIIDGIRRETRSRNQTEKEYVPPRLVSLDVAAHNLPDARAEHDYSAAESRLDVATLSKRLTRAQRSLVKAVYLRWESMRVMAAKTRRHESGISHDLIAARKLMAAVA